jgi:hypothetical protein
MAQMQSEVQYEQDGVLPIEMTNEQYIFVQMGVNSRFD